MNQLVLVEDNELAILITNNSRFSIKQKFPPKIKNKRSMPDVDSLQNIIIQNIVTDFLLDNCTQANVPIPKSEKFISTIEQLQKFFSAIYLAGETKEIYLYRVGKFVKETQIVYEKALSEGIIHPIFVHSFLNHSGKQRCKGKSEYRKLLLDSSTNRSKTSRDPISTLYTFFPSYFSYWFPAIFTEKEIKRSDLFNNMAMEGLEFILCGTVNSERIY